ncbi:hypothetical protein OH76DRAFT_525330 [Lentinus brumalis]|uniref:Uncharacterized protein n=1 Tax=Lentinus brumalis TaxID=2498619 RepID=A0A371CHQ4_9APHY|nr:hypothetical protein OH76DRAFT_525330 [Polyporus brumalis]
MAKWRGRNAVLLCFARRTRARVLDVAGHGQRAVCRCAACSSELLPSRLDVRRLYTGKPGHSVSGQTKRQAGQSRRRFSSVSRSRFWRDILRSSCSVRGGLELDGIASTQPRPHSASSQGPPGDGSKATHRPLACCDPEAASARCEKADEARRARSAVLHASRGILA